MGVNFTPPQEPYKEYKSFDVFFKSFVLQNFPLIEEDFDSLTYYQMLSKIVGYMKDVIDNNKAIQDNQEAVLEAYNELQNYVNNYFDTLDVQEEINNKLDAMVEDGTLPEIIETYINPYITQMNNTLNEFSTRINAIASGNPIPVSSISEMTDTTKSYLLTTDGYWYYYNGTNWVQGGQYQSEVVSNSDLAVDGRNTKSKNLAFYHGYNEFKPINEEYTFEYGDYGGTTGNPISLVEHTHRQRITSPIVIDLNESMTIYNMTDSYLAYKVYTCDMNDNIVNITGWLTNNSVETLFHTRSEQPVKHYILVQVNGHYNWDVTTHDLENIRILKTQINKENYLHGIFTPSVYNQACQGDNLFGSKIRCLTEFFDYDGQVKIKLNDGYECMIIRYNKSTKAADRQETAWTQSTLYYTFSNDYLYKIQFKKTDNSSILADEVIKNVKIYPIENASSSQVYNFSNMILNSHQGYSPEHTYGRDLAKNYKNSFLAGFKYAETDIKFTLDDVPVCCHGPSFISGDETIVIAEKTYAELQNIIYYDGEPVSSLDEVMANCKKYGLTLQLDHLSENFTQTQWNAIFDVIRKYQMQEYVIYSAGNQGLITKVLSFDPKATCMFNVTNMSRLSAILQTIHDNLNGDNKFILAINYTLITPEELSNLNKTLENNVYAGVYTIDSLSTLLTYLPYAYMIATNNVTPNQIINSFIE